MPDSADAPRPVDTPSPADLESRLARHQAFALLDPAQRADLARQIIHERTPPGTMLLAPGQLASRTGLLLAGVVELQEPELATAIRLGTGELFGAGVTPPTLALDWQASAVEPCEVAWLPETVLQALCGSIPALVYFLPWLCPSDSDRARPESVDSSGWMGTPVRALIQREPVTLPPQTTIHEAAQVMREAGVSSVLLVEQDRLNGVVTDRDLRNRVLALGLDAGRPLADIATPSPLTVSAGSAAFEALLLMTQHNIHHLPVMDGDRVVGLLTANDLARRQATSPVHLVGEVARQTTVHGLASITARVGQLQRQLAAAATSADSTGRIVTSITDAVTRRLLQLAHAQLGPAPVPYVWVAAGSQARSEQSARSDQDNCMVLDDSYEEARHADYFRELSRFVCDGLDACGYVHCPGDMMAMTEQWRQPLQRWKQYFHQWIEQPKPMALMLTCVFFDLRAIDGEAELLHTLRQDMLARTKAHSLFLAHMVSNALKHRPPLGLLGNIAPLRGGAHAGTIDLKHNGIVPVVDLARIYALAGGIAAVNTQERLAMAAQSGEISAQSARDLGEALEFLGRMRIAHQARQTHQGQSPDNHLAPQELSNFERSQLKDAFGVVQTLQSVLAQRYQGGHFG